VNKLNLLAAIHSLAEQRARAVLSAIGIMVGAIAIVLLISIAQGVRKDITQQVNDLGVNLLVVLPFRVEEGSMFMPNAAGLSYLRIEDLERVRKIAGVRRAAPLVFVGGGIRAGSNQSPQTFIIAAGPEWFRIRPVTMQEGRAYTPEETGRVAVIGSIAKKNLFGDGSAVGRSVTINGKQYRVIGVTEDKESEGSLFSMGSFENIAYIPYGNFRAESDEPQLHRIMVQTEPDREPKALRQAVESALGERLERETYSVQTVDDLLKLVYKLMGILTWLLTGLTSIALFVGGVGIMTVMLMSVNERSKEIGIRKTVGARRRDIFQQFLCEAVILAIVGVGLGLLVSWIACVALYLWTPIKPLVTTDTVLLCLGVSIGVGSTFGLLPAVNAARKDPVVAMRHE